MKIKYNGVGLVIQIEQNRYSRIEYNRIRIILRTRIILQLELDLDFE